MVYIFIRNKLISCDSILPVAMELYEKKGIKSTFVTFDSRTYNTIVKNYFLYDAINKVGELKYVGKPGKRHISRFIKGFFLIKMLLKIIFQKVYTIHFGNIEEGLLSLILKFNNKDRIFYTETDASGFSKFMFKVDFCRRDYEYNIDNILAPQKGNLLHFGQEWLWLEDKRVAHLPKIHHPYPRSRDTWMNYIIDNSQKYVSDLSITKPVIAYFITGFCHIDIIRDENTTRTKFRETLKVLEKECPDYTILIKPHPICDMDEVHAIMSEFPELDIRLSYLHPSLLGYIAKMTICNFYSTAVYDSTLFNVPTIEFTDYCDAALKLSDNRSQRPDHINYFIQNDVDKFIDILRECKSKDKYVVPRPEVSPETKFLSAIQ